MEIQEKQSNVRGRFTRTFIESLDKRFLRVLVGSIAVHMALVFYFLANPISEEEALNSIDKIQRQIAKALQEREALKEEQQYVQFEFKQQQADGLAKGLEVKKPANKPKQTAALKVPKKQLADVPQGSGARTSARARRRRVSRSRIASRVRNKGVLAVLASTSSAASGNSVANLLGEADASAGDLDSKMAAIAGIRSARASDAGRGHEIRGMRLSSSGDIDASAADIGDGGSSVFERSGDFEVASASPLIEGGGGGGILGRQQDDIQAVIVKHNKSIQNCYERELRRNPNLRGKLTVRFTITPRGRVSKVELVSSTLENTKVERCVMSRIRRWNDFGDVDDSYGSTTIRQSYAFGY